MKIIEVLPETCVDGPGLRMSIYVAGCEHLCPGCHNPSTWRFDQGEELSNDFITNTIKDYNDNPLLYGLTFSGGDPLHPQNVAGVNKFLEAFYLNVPANKRNVWIYTGYTTEDLFARIQGWNVNSDNQDYLLENIFKHTGVVVDGEFIEELKDVSLQFRGSSNQHFFAAKRYAEKYSCLTKIDMARLKAFDVTYAYMRRTA